MKQYEYDKLSALVKKFMRGYEFEDHMSHQYPYDDPRCPAHIGRCEAYLGCALDLKEVLFLYCSVNDTIISALELLVIMCELGQCDKCPLHDVDSGCTLGHPQKLFREAIERFEEKNNDKSDN